MPSPSPFNFIAFYRPTRGEMLVEGPTERERGAIAGHVAFLADLHAKGIVWFAGRTQIQDDRTRGICIFKADSQVQAESLLANDPCLKAGVMAVEIFSFKVAVPAD